MYGEDDLRRWAEAHEPVGMAQAPVILRLLDDRERLATNLLRIIACASHVGVGTTVSEICDGVIRQHDRIVALQDLNLVLADRVHQQSELLSRKAEAK